MGRYTWDRLRYSGDVRIYGAYNDTDNEWVVRAVYKKYIKATTHIPYDDWMKETNQAIDTKKAWEYVFTRGMSEIVCDDNNPDIADNCSYTDTGAVHISFNFKNAWSIHDKGYGVTYEYK